jgi:hypothetical protein
MTVYHEARHGEQHFRIARLEAGEGKELDPSMDADAAAAAADNPLKARGANAQELREARDWYSVEHGEDATYREAVTDWQGGIREMARLARDVKPDGAAGLRERIGRLLKGWSKYGGAAEYVRSHLSSARKRGMTTIVKNISRINTAYDVVAAEYAKLGANPTPEAFKPLAKALADLYRAVNKAYEEAPVEFDAYRAGDAVFDGFHAALKTQRKKRATAAAH